MRTVRLLLWVLLLPALAAAERRISVTNAATPYDVGESFRVAPGSLIRVSWVFEPDVPPVWMAPTARVILQGSTAVDAKVLEIADGQTIVALVPSDTPEGPVQIVVDTSEERSAPLTGEIVRHAFRIFTIDNGFGPALAHNGLAHPARAGDVVSLWGTGLNGATVTASIAGASAEILYSGPAPSLPGVDQINVRMPANVPDGCYTNVALTAGGEAANPVTLTTGSGPCKHPLGLSADQLNQLDAGQPVTMALAGIYSSIVPPPMDPPRWDLVTRMENAASQSWRSIHARLQPGGLR